MDEFKPDDILIEINGETYQLKYTFASIIEIEKKYGSLDNLLIVFNQKRYSTILTLLYLGLKHNKNFIIKYPSEDDLAKVLDPKKVIEYDDKIGKALEVAFPGQQSKKEETPPV